MIPPNQFFSDVDQLLVRSQPTRSRLRLWQAGIIFLSMLVLGGLLGNEAGAAGDAVSAIILLGLFGALISISGSTVRRARWEASEINSIEELVQLRCWPQAAALLRGLLNRPMQLPSHRATALMLLGGVLNRYDLFEPALQVQETLLGERQLDSLSEQSIRLARAATLLRQDRLYDADRAIVEMRRQINRLNENAALETPAAMLAAGLSLVELYRDVKTGHPTEALELFTAKLPLLRAQLGHRVSEAYVLAARAAQLLNQPALAAGYYTDATTLAPAVELHRRYPETAELSRTFTAAIPPREAE